MNDGKRPITSSLRESGTVGELILLKAAALP
jgi:hypothetical protein